MRKVCKGLFVTVHVSGSHLKGGIFFFLISKYIHKNTFCRHATSSGCMFYQTCCISVVGKQPLFVIARLKNYHENIKAQAQNALALTMKQKKQQIFDYSSELLVPEKWKRRDFQTVIYRELRF